MRPDDLRELEWDKAKRAPFNGSIINGGAITKKAIRLGVDYPSTT
jgi:hypothetical protein